ncbi:lipase family protein [Streptomyces sp. NPDC051453]|uniref:lipase family protein n=1 Tax=Streptomyces sp. NPDC051453 TaxID=3154941 RepID=UPI003446BDFA
MTFTRLHGRIVASGALALVCAVTVSAGTGHTGTQRSPSPSLTNASQQTPTRGSLVSVTLVADLDAEQVEARLEKAGIDAAQARYGVRAHRIVYRTIDREGRPTTASALVATPKNHRQDLRVVSWLHGTEVYRGEVASVNDRSPDRTTALLFASSGLAVSAPDYLGLGEGPGIHPYGDPKATVTASLDALRATRAFVQDAGRDIDRKVLVSGFSQGGPATMLLGRALNQGADAYFRLGALAPIGGPFDLSGFEAAAADDKLDRSPLYLAYFATAWNRMYGLYDSPGQAFRAPNDKKVEKLFDGNHTGGEIADALPPTSKALFTDEFLNKVRNPKGVLRHRLHAMDTTCDWRPEVPVHLFHATGDKDVPFTNSQLCGAQLDAKGADFELTDVGDVDHNTTVLKALPHVVHDFMTAR